MAQRTFAKKTKKAEVEQYSSKGLSYFVPSNKSVVLIGRLSEPVQDRIDEAARNQKIMPFTINTIDEEGIKKFKALEEEIINAHLKFNPLNVSKDNKIVSSVKLLPGSIYAIKVRLGSVHQNIQNLADVDSDTEIKFCLKPCASLYDFAPDNSASSHQEKKFTNTDRIIGINWLVMDAEILSSNEDKKPTYK